jgi:hypothetical protein
VWTFCVSTCFVRPLTLEESGAISTEKLFSERDPPAGTTTESKVVLVSVVPIGALTTGVETSAVGSPNGNGSVSPTPDATAGRGTPPDACADPDTCADNEAAILATAPGSSSSPPVSSEEVRTTWEVAASAFVVIIRDSFGVPKIAAGGASVINPRLPSGVAVTFDRFESDEFFLPPLLLAGVWFCSELPGAVCSLVVCVGICTESSAGVSLVTSCETYMARNRSLVVAGEFASAKKVCAGFGPAAVDAVGIGEMLFTSLPADCEFRAVVCIL